MRSRLRGACNVAVRDDASSRAIRALKEHPTAELQAEFEEEAAEEVVKSLATVKVQDSEIAHLRKKVE